MQSKIYRSFISRSKDEIHLLQHAHKCLNLHSQRNNYLKIYPIQLIVQHSSSWRIVKYSIIIKNFT
ncbi:hypothetical protein FHEFKHOI_01432 [Candidatus Methanoperedenaceae archaeon GB50]|nr:MAG: hypothetical protein KBONHNOK_00289 [Candidatus Methanoperedenaceae archaeon GB50]CAD7773644.1 hypothetical protein FHEFKHOI_01432 [Candidatus Methanoperedenaceae archaeon GB50]